MNELIDAFNLLLERADRFIDLFERMVIAIEKQIEIENNAQSSS